MFIKLKLFILLSLFEMYYQQDYYYPEDFTSLDRLSYASNEEHMTSYYFTTDSTNQSSYFYDFRNGIRVYQFNRVYF